MAEQWDIPWVLDDTFKATGCFQPLIDDFEADIVNSSGRTRRNTKTEKGCCKELMFRI